MKLFKIIGSTSELSLNLAHPIFLDENINYKIGLVGFYSDNNICNVLEDSHITFEIEKSDKSKFNNTIKISKGFWSITELNNHIKKQLKDDKFYIKGNDESKIIICSPHHFKLDNNLRKLLGFETFSKNEIEKSFKSLTEHKGKYKPNLRPFDVIEIHCNLVESSFTNHNTLEHVHEETEILYSFFPNVSYRSKISESPSEIFYVPIKKGTNKIQKIKISIKNERDELLKNENVMNIIYLSLIQS